MRARCVAHAPSAVSADARSPQDGRPIYIEQLGKLDIKALYNVCVRS